MAKLFDRLFHKKQAVASNANKSAYAKLPRPKYDFVEQYTIVDPKRVLGNYEFWQMCETIPVICEESPETSGGFRSGIQLPTNIVLGFLRLLNGMPAEKIADPKMRTISIIHLSKDQRVVIGPSPDPFKQLSFLTPDSVEQGEWVLHVTPATNRAIVEQLKIHTR